MRSNLPPRKKRNFDEDDEGESFVPKRPGVPEDEGDPLWTIYAVNPGLPFRIKVEQLMVMWELDVPEIASALKEDEDRVQTEVDRLELEWMDLGGTLTDDAKQKARGRAIRELLKYKAELEALGPTQDPKIITMKIKIAEQISALRGIERGERKEPSEGSGDPIADALSSLSADKLRDLSARLDRPD